MSKWFAFIIVGTLVGLLIVHGEVEAVKTGYDIRQLSMRKHELNHRVKTVESEIARLTAYETLEIQMAKDKNQFIQPAYKQIARVQPEHLKEQVVKSDSQIVLAKWFVGTARAQD